MLNTPLSTVLLQRFGQPSPSPAVVASIQACINSPAGGAVFLQNLHRLICNSSFSLAKGFDINDFNGLPVTEWPDEIGGSLTSHCLRALKEGAPGVFETHDYLPGKSLHVTTVPLFDSNGCFGIQLVEIPDNPGTGYVPPSSMETEDINEVFASLSTANIAYFSYHTRCGEVVLSPYVKEFLPAPAGIATEEYLKTLLDEQDQQKLFAGVRSALQKPPHTFENKFSITGNAGNADRTFRVFITCHPGQGHECNHISGVITDITKKVRLADELALARQRLELALDSGRFGVVDYDIDNGEVRCDKRHLLNLGLSEGDKLTPEKFGSITEPQSLKHNSVALRRAARTLTPFSLTYKLLPKHNVTRWFKLVGNSYINSKTGHTHVVALSYDITADASLEAKKDEFISVISHELKTPLTGIKAYNQLLGKLVEQPAHNSFVQKTARQIARLEKLINDMLDVNRIFSGRMKYQKVHFNFKELLTETVENFIQATACNITIEEAFAYDYFGDRIRLQQAIEILLSNAVKYSSATSPISVLMYIQGPHIVIDVKDHGIGIDATVLARLFSRYYTGDNAALKKDGFGLGLFIANEIVKYHNGSISAESTPGKGSKFTISLPLSVSCTDTEE